jgi:ribonucleoside-triphosphate reductase
MKEWSNLAKIVMRRTYARKDNPITGFLSAPDAHGERYYPLENWDEIIEREVAGNVKGRNVPEKEIQDLLRYGKERKAIPAGRGLWFSGTSAHSKLGGVALNNCWFCTSGDWYNFVVLADLLMLGGGVGASVEHRFTSKLPRVKKGVVITHQPGYSAGFIVPDTREGWCELMHRVYESYFVTGKSFTYSTSVLRGAGQPIKGFGGVSSGPLPLIKFVDQISNICNSRSGRHIRPIDAADIITAIGEVVVSGNVRRSAILILGDCWDKEFLTAKRWDIGPIPAHRSNANYSVVCEDVDDLHPLYWKTFEAGEAFGLINRKNIQKYGRMGELKKDTAVGVNPCGEATLEPFEPCNLQEIILPNIENLSEFKHAAYLMQRYGQRVTLENYHHEEIQEVVSRNRRVGTSITGCLASPLFNDKDLDHVYTDIQRWNKAYAQELGIPESIRTTTNKPSGTVSKVCDMDGYEGVHAALSRYIIQRIRFASNDQLIPLLRNAGHYMESVKKFDGTIDHGTQVVDFYVEAPEGSPVVDEGFDTWSQLKVWELAQRHWSDQAVSVSVYYKHTEIPKIKEWMANNIQNIKTISFMAESEHGYLQAPKQKITEEQYEKLSEKITPINIDSVEGGDLDSQECAGGLCPVK